MFRVITLDSNNRFISYSVFDNFAECNSYFAGLPDSLHYMLVY